MTADRFLLACFAVGAVAVAIALVRERILPRRRGSRLVDEVARELGFARTRGPHGDTLLAGRFGGCDVAISISRVGYAIQRPDTLPGVIEMVRAATALANDLERTR